MCTSLKESARAATRRGTVWKRASAKRSTTAQRTSRCSPLIPNRTRYSLASASTRSATGNGPSNSCRKSFENEYPYGDAVSVRSFIRIDPATGEFEFFPDLIFKPEFGGAALSSNFTFLPTGFSGDADALVASLTQNAGRQDFSLSDFTAQERSGIESAGKFHSCEHTAQVWSAPGSICRRRGVAQSRRLTRRYVSTRPAWHRGAEPRITGQPVHRLHQCVFPDRPDG